MIPAIPAAPSGCAGDPVLARGNLEGAMRALPRRAARELRVLVLELDEAY
ncbi:hypothetical protein OG729_25490 [Streptomyces sp. NBC_00210]